jgi:hypothetical protein
VTDAASLGSFSGKVQILTNLLFVPPDLLLGWAQLRNRARGPVDAGSSLSTQGLGVKYTPMGLEWQDILYKRILVS